jgi:hypothetical protein
MEKEQPKILIYNMEMDERFRAIRRYLNRTGVTIRPVQAPEYLESIGYLLELPGCRKNPLFNLGGNFREEMMVMSGFSGDRLDAFLQFFHEMQLEPVALKAIVTPHNCSWNSLQLHDELLREHHTVSH